MRSFVSRQRLQGIGTGVPVSITAGVVNVATAYHVIDTEGMAATDDLTTINGIAADEMMLVLRSASPDRVIVLKHGSGNLILPSATDVTLNDTNRTVILWYVAAASKWYHADLACGLLSDRFRTSRAAGAVHGTNAEPGPGTRTAADTASRLFIGAPTYLNALAIGDSKTANYTWPQLMTYASGSTVAVQEKPARIATGGWTVAAAKAALDAALASRTDTPNYVLINLGINDTVSLPAEAAWKADYQYIINALHTKYASATIYMTTLWRANAAYDANVATVNGWIAALIALNTPTTVAGVDESTILPGNNDGDVHPTAAGNLLYAAAWRTVLGL